MESVFNVTQDEILQAVLNNDVAIVKELLNIGMDVNMLYQVVEPDFPTGTKIVHKTLLTLACGINTYIHGDNINMIKLLIEYGADVNKHGLGQFNDAPLIKCLYSRKEIIELLLKNGANPNIYSENFSNIPLYHYIYTNEYEMVELLLKYHADPNITNSNGDTPLHYCVYQGRYEIAKLLLKHGANPDIKNNNGHTPYELSKIKGFGYFGYSISSKKKIADFIENQQKLQEAEQKLAFMSSLNPRLGVNAFNKVGYDLLEKIASIPIEYNHSVYNRVRDEKSRDPLIKAMQKSKSMIAMHSREGPFSSLRYEPNIMEGIFRHLSNMRPDARVHTRIDQQNKRTKKRKRR